MLLKARLQYHYHHYHLVTATIKLKLWKVEQQSQRRKQRDIAKLKCPKTNREFVLELRNRFSALADSTEDDHDINTKWESIKTTYVETAIQDVDH